MFDRILVPLDGSETAESALLYAQRLAASSNAEIDLVCAIPTHVGVELPVQITKDVNADAEAYLARVAASLPKAMRPRYEVKSGDPAVVIVDQAEAQKDTLIVMGTRGYSGLKRWMLGSVAHKVVQVAETPVLLIPTGAKNPEGGPVDFHRVIVPLDGSDVAEYILPPVIELCRALKLELILVRAYNPVFPGSSVRMHEISTIVHDAAESYLEAKAAELKEICGKEIAYKVLRGVPAEQITDFALEAPNSLTAMCTHGRHGPGRWLLGSVTDAVIHSSEEPVFVVRAAKLDADG